MKRTPEALRGVGEGLIAFRLALLRTWLLGFRV